MFKWVEIALENNRPRYEALSQFLKQHGFENEVHFLQVQAETLPQSLPEILQKYDGIRVGRGLGEVIVPLFLQQTALVEKIRAADSILKFNNNWWLRTNAVEGFSRILKRHGERFDFLSPVLVVGSGAAARVAVTSLFMAGFKIFAISSLDAKKVQEMINDFKKTMFGAQFRIVLKEELILLPGTHGLLVNTTPLTKENPMLDELYYFNFFSSGGVAVDFSITPVETPLLKAAVEIGATAIYGYQISAATDLIWCQQISGRQFPLEEYEKILKEALHKS